jgi:RimJ/RimL family protein N-acetyltransferase
MHSNTLSKIQLETSSVLLRPLQANDDQYLQHYAVNAPEIFTYLLVQPNNMEEMKSYVDKAIKSTENGNSLAFIVYDKTTQEYAGCTRIYDIDWEHKNLQIGYTWYGKKFWGTHINKHCKYLLLHHAFETMQFERAGFRADARNERSIAAIKSLGCQVEGVLRSHMYLPQGGRRDSILLSMLKHEWFSHCKTNLLAQIHAKQSTF